MRHLSRLILENHKRTLKDCARVCERGSGGRINGMGKPQENRRELADEHYEEIGRSVAAMMVESGMGPGKIWALVGGIGLYRYWMLAHWADRYREEHGTPKPSRRRRKGQQQRKALIDSLAPQQEP